MLRGAALLGEQSCDDRSKIFTELKAAYRERSITVHGGEARTNVTVSNERIEFVQFVSSVEEHLRSAIKKFLILCEKDSEKSGFRISG